MTTLREAATQALEALEERYVGALRDKAMDALKAALAQPDQRISDDPIYIGSDGGFYPMPRQRKPLEGEEP
jgi:hypothetical protein